MTADNQVTLEVVGSRAFMPPPPLTEKLLKRFWSKVSPEPNSGCWLWTGSVNLAQYGRLTVEGRTHQAHRLSWAIAHGPLHGRMVIDHLCRNPTCVNPDHLEPVTNQENGLRGDSGRRITHCPQGHEYTEANIYWQRATGTTGEKTNRCCRTCRSARDVARNEQRRLRLLAAREKRS